MAETPKNLKSEWGSLTSSEFQSNEKWWPDALNLRMLHQRHPGSSPLGDCVRLPRDGGRHRHRRAHP